MWFRLVFLLGIIIIVPVPSKLSPKTALNKYVSLIFMCKFLHMILIDIGLLEQTSAFKSSDQYGFPEFRVEKPL